ncbi:MAG: VapC toxin family PIN domain ribonuclease, partial [Chloroflexota bacterium]
MKLLIDTNIFLEVLLEQVQANDAQALGMTVILLSASDLESVVQSAQKHNLDFDDAYQYTAAERDDL